MNWSQVSVLLCANSQTHRNLVQQILLSIGVKDITASPVVLNSSTLVTSRHSLIIGQLNPKDLTILDMVQWIRNPQSSPAAGIPVLVSVNTPDRRLLASAIKAGIDLLVAEPLTIEKMKSRMSTLLSAPPERITTRNYHGPCRRRAPDAFNPYTGTDRRMSGRAVA